MVSKNQPSVFIVNCNSLLGHKPQSYLHIWFCSSYLIHIFLIRWCHRSNIPEADPAMQGREHMIYWHRAHRRNRQRSRGKRGKRKKPSSWDLRCGPSLTWSGRELWSGNHSCVQSWGEEDGLPSCTCIDQYLKTWLWWNTHTFLTPKVCLLNKGANDVRCEVWRSWRNQGLNRSLEWEWCWVCSSMVECLSSMLKALGLIPGHHKTQNKQFCF